MASYNNFMWSSTFEWLPKVSPNCPFEVAIVTGSSLTSKDIYWSLWLSCTARHDDQFPMLLPKFLQLLSCFQLEDELTIQLPKLSQSSSCYPRFAHLSLKSRKLPKSLQKFTVTLCWSKPLSFVAKALNKGAVELPWDVIFYLGHRDLVSYDGV